VRRLAAAVLVLVAAACGGGAPPAPPPAGPTGPEYLVEVEAWHAERQAALREPDGWLSLVGLYWLEEGASSFGADPANDLVLPADKAPPRLGVLYRTGSRVRLEVEPGVEITRDGEPVERLELVTDASDEATELEYGNLLFFMIERGERVGLRLKDRDSELLRTFTGIERYPVDPAWRLEARFEAYPEPRMVAVPDFTGDVREEPSHGEVVFTAGGAERRLAPLGEPDDELFLVFGDTTNGGETYGGGRFLFAGPPDEEGRLVVDFNKAFNPPCVFTPYATCPLPPPGNRLELAVTAGEKSFGKGH
jgi:uncharacterized protein (DUF1684 family)